jgi:hypothetical protein
MKFSTAISISAAVGLVIAQGFTLPDLADGSYIISIGGDGSQIATALPDAVNETTTTEAASAKRGAAAGGVNSRIVNKRFNWPSGTYPWCPGGDWFLQDDFYNHGFSAFWDSCNANGGHKFPANTVFANYQGTSVSYMCAYTTNPCNPAEWSDAVNWAASNCHGRSNGWMEPGELSLPQKRDLRLFFVRGC